MLSIREYYRKRIKIFFLIPPLILLMTVAVYFFIMEPRYQERVTYINENKKVLYDDFYKQASEENQRKNAEEDPDSEKYWVLDDDRLELAFEDSLILKRNGELIVFAIISFFVFAFSFPFAIKMIQQPLYCRHCLKTVLPSSVVPFICPFCDTHNDSFLRLFTHCKESGCKSIIPSVTCPHCKKQIDLLGEYDIEKIKSKRYGKKI